MAKNHRVRRQRWIVKVKIHYGCRLCKEKDISCLTLHHIDPATKERKVCKCLSNFSIRVIREEINKCVILCLNCHAKVEAGTKTVTKDMMCNITEGYELK